MLVVDCEQVTQKKEIQIDSIEMTISQEQLQQEQIIQKNIQQEENVKQNQILLQSDDQLNNDEQRYLLKDVEVSFKLNQFMESFIWHVAFCVLLGPVLYLIGIYLNKKILFDNFYFGPRLNKLQIILYIFWIIILIIAFFKELKYVQRAEIIMMGILIVFRQLIIASKYGTYSKQKWGNMVFHQKDQINTQIIPESISIKEFQLADWLQQSLKTVQNEITQVIERNSIEVKMFKLEFLDKINYCKNNLDTDNVEEIGSLFDLHDGHNFLSNVIHKISTKIFQRYQKVFILVLFFAFLYAIFPFYYRHLKFGQAFADDFFESLLMVLMFFLNWMFFAMNLAFVLVALIDMNRLLEVNEYLSEIIAVKSNEFDPKEHELPKINVFDLETFKSWNICKQIIRKYGYKFYLRQQLYLGAFLIYYSLVLVVCIVSVTNLAQILDQVTIYQNLIQVVFTFSLIFVILIVAVSINLLLENDIYPVIQLERMYVELLTDVDYYFSEEYTTNKSNKYYLATNSIKNNPKNISIQNYLSKLKKMSSQVVNEIYHLAQFNQVRVLGIKATPEFLTSILTFVGSTSSVIASALFK